MNDEGSSGDVAVEAFRAEDLLSAADVAGRMVYCGSLALAVWNTSVFVVRRRRGEASLSRADRYLVFWCCFGCLYCAFTAVELYASLLSLGAIARLLRGVVTFALSLRLANSSSSSGSGGGSPNRFAAWVFRTVVQPRLTHAEPELDKVCADAGVLWSELRSAVRPAATAMLLRLSSDADPLAIDYAGAMAGAQGARAVSGTGKRGVPGRRVDAGGASGGAGMDGGSAESGGDGARLSAPAGGDRDPVFVVQGRRNDATVRPVLLARAEMQDGGGSAASRLTPAPRRFQQLHELRKKLGERRG